MTLAFDQCQQSHSSCLLNLNWFILLLEISNLIFLLFNILVKSATANFVLLNSVIVDVKFLVAVSKLFEVSKQCHSNRKFMQQFLIELFLNLPLRSFFTFPSATFISWPTRWMFTTQSNKLNLILNEFWAFGLLLNSVAKFAVLIFVSANSFSVAKFIVKLFCVRILRF
jgi:hypothetical protein